VIITTIGFAFIMLSYSNSFDVHVMPAIMQYLSFSDNSVSNGIRGTPGHWSGYSNSSSER